MKNGVPSMASAAWARSRSGGVLLLKKGKNEKKKVEYRALPQPPRRAGGARRFAA
jgi:hypothetical protein